MNELQLQVEKESKKREEYLSQLGDHKTQLAETRVEKDFLRRKLNEVKRNKL